MTKPLIGVLPLYDEEKDSLWMLPGYMDAIEEAGAVPVMLPLTTDEEAIRSLSATYDGFLFTGGHDLNPELYGETAEDFCEDICEKRDKLETALFKEVLRLDKPAFGICRGLQLFNVATGGTLYQDIPAQTNAEKYLAHKQSKPYDKPVHSINIEKDSPLFGILQSETILVNSLHHQGIKTLSDQLAAVAAAEDGLIEAAYMPGKKFVLAVQWHPEYSYKSDIYSSRLFQAFVKASRQENSAFFSDGRKVYS